MTENEKLKAILNMAHGNMRYADPFDRMNLKKGSKLGVEGFTTQSVEEALADLICDLQDFEHELLLNGSMEGASL